MLTLAVLVACVLALVARAGTPPVGMAAGHRQPTLTAPPPPTPTPPPAPLPDLIVEGFVFDLEAGGAPIPDAVVTLAVCYDRPDFTSTTGVDGRFRLRMPRGELNPCSHVTLNVLARGYAPWRRRILVEDLRREPRRDVGLRPAQLAHLPFAAR